MMMEINEATGKKLSIAYARLRLANLGVDTSGLTDEEVEKFVTDLIERATKSMQALSESVRKMGATAAEVATLLTEYQLQSNDYFAKEASDEAGV